MFVVLATQNPIEQEGVYPLSKAQEDRFAFKVVIEYPRADELTKIVRDAFDVGHPGAAGFNHRDEHVRTLYFFARLRSLLLGPSSQKHWFSEPNRGLREKIEALVDFTHFCPQSSRGDGMLPGVQDGKNSELEADAVDLVQETSPASHRHRADLWHDLVRHGEPLSEVLSGSSPRGLLKLIRAAHAEAFLRGHIEGERVHPEWCDFRAVAHDVLRHRIRLSPGAEAMGAVRRGGGLPAGVDRPMGRRAMTAPGGRRSSRGPMHGPVPGGPGAAGVAVLAPGHARPAAGRVPLAVPLPHGARTRRPPRVHRRRRPALSRHPPRPAVAGDRLARRGHAARGGPADPIDPSRRIRVHPPPGPVPVDVLGLLRWRRGRGLGPAGRTKLQSLYMNAAAYLSLAEAMHFALRVIYVHGDVPEQQRGPRGT